MIFMLKLIGYWSDAPEFEGDWIHPKYLLQLGVINADQDQLVSYLKSGLIISRRLGYSFCRLPGGPPNEEMGCADRTDGVWVWPEGLWVYVSNYGIELPREFAEHVKDNGFKIPSDLDVSALRKGMAYDLTYWEDWCKKKKFERNK